MSVAIAPEFVDTLFMERDYMGLYRLISMRLDGRTLPPPCHLFQKALEWEGSRRSGVWQYYENLKNADYDANLRLFRQFDLSELADQFEEGMRTWKDGAEHVDQWIDRNSDSIYETILEILRACSDELKRND